MALTVIYKSMILHVIHFPSTSHFLSLPQPIRLPVIGSSNRMYPEPNLFSLIPLPSRFHAGSRRTGILVPHRSCVSSGEDIVVV